MHRLLQRGTWRGHVDFCKEAHGGGQVDFCKEAHGRASIDFCKEAHGGRCVDFCKEAHGGACILLQRGTWRGGDAQRGFWPEV